MPSTSHSVRRSAWPTKEAAAGMPDRPQSAMVEDSPVAEVVARLFREYHRQVRATFVRQGFSADDAKDLTQETFFRVYRGIGGFRHEANPRTWIFTIAARVGINWIRDRHAGKRQATLVPLDVADEAASPKLASVETGNNALDRRLIDRERLQRARSVLAEFPEPMRRCLLMFVDQQLTYGEIAVVMRMSVAKVKALIHEARCRLRDHFDEELAVHPSAEASEQGAEP